MLKAMCCGALVITLTVVMPEVWAVSDSSLLSHQDVSDLTFDQKTVLVYENQTGEESHQFVLRIARFHPDIFLEWESFNHQGTLHLRKKAVADAKKLTVGGLFEAGVDMESKDVMTNWFSAALYQTLIKHGKAKVQFNKHKIKMNVIGEETRRLTVDKEQVELPVVRVQDSQMGSWIVYKNLNNPVLIEYQSRHYHMRLTRISTSKANNFRWINKLPPVK